ncbi:MAG TPA: acetyl-CoA carboxylase biotin carboxyl carrier protein [Candidatus Acidoferrum sp.]|jgi:acetyl-CoA carboxylase biotin carboxyl carrier protein
MKRKKPSKPAKGSAFANPEIQQIEQLLHFMSEHKLEEFEYSRGDLKIRLKKPSAGMGLAVSRGPSTPEIVGHAGEAAGAKATPAPEAALASVTKPAEDLHVIKSPIVGTYYGAPSPGAEPFVKVGGFVDAGKTLCIVEAMKLMNEIESDMSGEVVRIYLENGQPVEYGQALFAIRPGRQK